MMTLTLTPEGRGPMSETLEMISYDHTSFISRARWPRLVGA